MMNPQVKVILPAILKILILNNFCTSFYIIFLYALFFPTFIHLICLRFCTMHVLYIHAKKKSNNNYCA